jgi:hypothetical protein
MKKCTRCLLEKPLTDFKNDRSRSDGHFPWCRACCREEYVAQRDGVKILTSPTKRCRVCRRRKRVASFSVNRAMRDGLESHCRRCKWTRGRSRHKPVALPRLPVRTCAYVAGLLDGEGCVRIDISTRREYNLCISITNTHRGVVEWLHSTLGGNIWNHAAGTPRHKPTWRWGLTKRRGLGLLQQLLPHLIIKREHALKVLDFYKRLGRWKYADDTKNPHFIAPPETLPADLLVLLEEIINLNLRGGSKRRSVLKHG